MKRLELRDVTVKFGAVHALAGVTLELSAGEVLMLVGPNGAGKSTLMSVLLGLVRPDHGELRVDGQVRSLRGDGIKHFVGYLPEAVAFSDSLTGRQVLRFFAWARGASSKRIDVVLERVGLTHAAGRSVRGYSRGMRQRLGVGVAILSEPELLILDEPTGGLDQEGLTVLWSVLEEWRDEGRTVLLASHDLALLERRVARICLMSNGRVKAEGTPDALRLRAGLPHRVNFELRECAAERVSELLGALTELGLAPSEVVERRCFVDVAPDGLLPLMAAQARFPDAVAQLRVLEPQLDQIYERLLAEESPS